MKKRIIKLLMLWCLAVSVMGCGKGSGKLRTYKGYTFKVETGDSIRVNMDTSDKYDITSDLPVKISCDGDVLSQGTFIKAEYYDQYAEVVSTDEKAELIDSGTKDGNKYVYWEYANKEYNYVVLIGDSNTGIVLGNNVSQESAKECFERLTINVAE